MVDSASVKEEIELIKMFENDPIYFIEVFLGRTLSEKQKSFLEATKTKKHILNLWSRQTGKSTVTASYLVWRLLYGKGGVVKVNEKAKPEYIKEQIAIVAPIKDQHVLIYDKMSTLINKSEFISNFIIKMNSEKIVAKNGNFCKFMSASPGSQIRGFTATCIVIDESQDITDAKYSGDVLPFGATTNAIILESGTPKTKNHFYKSILSPNVTVVKQMWFECPFLSKEYVMGQKEISPDALWRQEYLCEFVEEGVLAFPSRLFEPESKNGRPTGREVIQKYDYLSDYQLFTKAMAEKIIELVNNGAEFVAGLDLGKQNDNTVFTIWRTDERPIRLQVMLKFPLDTQYKKIAQVIGMFYKAYQWCEFNFDYTNEKGFMESLIENNVPAFIDKTKKRSAIAFTQKNKAEMVNTAVTLLEKFQVALPASAEKLLSEFLNQQYETDPLGRKKFYHPSNENDDSLWSTLLAWKNIMISREANVRSTFVNPWERRDEQVHGPKENSVKEVLFANQKSRRDYRETNRSYMPADLRRSQRYAAYV